MKIKQYSYHDKRHIIKLAMIRHSFWAKEVAYEIDGDVICIGIDETDPSVRIIRMFIESDITKYLHNRWPYKAITVISVNNDNLTGRFIGAINMFQPITYIRMPDNANSNLMRAISDILMDPKCTVNLLSISHLDNLKLDDIYLLFDAISKNRSLTEVKFRGTNDKLKFLKPENINEIMTRFGNTIKSHPRLNRLKLSGFRDFSTLNILRSIPVSLKYLIVKDCNLSKNDVICIANNTRLLFFGDLLYPEDCNGHECVDRYNALMTSRSLITATMYTCNDESCNKKFDKGVLKSVPFVSEITMNFEFNTFARQSAIKAALCLIAIRKFRWSNAGLLGHVPMDVIKIIAGMVILSYTDDSWHSIKTRLRKRKQRR